jgi:hypothetical protein
MTTLHAGGKFHHEVYETSGGLHGVGVSVANALSELLEVEVARGGELYKQTYKRGVPQGPVKLIQKGVKRRGTRVRLRPDPQIFGEGAGFKARACLPHDQGQGLSLRRRGNPLDLRQVADQGNRYSREGVVPFRERFARLSRTGNRRPDARHAEPFAARRKRKVSARPSGRSPGPPITTDS